MTKIKNIQVHFVESGYVIQDAFSEQVKTKLCASLNPNRHSRSVVPEIVASIGAIFFAFSHEKMAAISETLQ